VWITQKMGDESDKERKMAQTTVRIEDELLEAVKLACIHRKSDQTKAINAGLRMWLDPSNATPPDALSALPKERRALIKRMMAIWERAPERVQSDLDKVVSGLLGAMEKVTGLKENN
jgi:hypothetical protein